MARRRKYTILFAPETLDHLDAIERKDHRFIQEAIDEQLSYEPGVPTRNRKPLEEPSSFGAAWELRRGPRNRFRIFYEIDPGRRIVFVLAIGQKEGSRLLIGGEEFEL